MQAVLAQVQLYLLEGAVGFQQFPEIRSWDLAWVSYDSVRGSEARQQVTARSLP